MNIYNFDLHFLLGFQHLALRPGQSLPFSRSTQSTHRLPVLSLFPVTSTVKSRQSSSKLELLCLYSERSQIQSVKWTYQDKSRELHLVSSSPGRITAVLPTPITADTAGNYTCTLQLSNGQTVWATESVALPSKGMRSALTKTGLFSYFLLSPV